jgi:hypothetical protein
MVQSAQPQGRNLEARYANYFELGRNANELVIDFGQCYGSADQPAMHTRIIIVPAYARDLVRLLSGWLHDAPPPDDNDAHASKDPLS